MITNQMVVRFPLRRRGIRDRYCSRESDMKAAYQILRGNLQSCDGSSRYRVPDELFDKLEGKEE